MASYELGTISKGMKWLLLSMLVPLSGGIFCRESGNCSCREVSYSRCEIRCPSDSIPKFSARLNIYAADIQVECHDAISWSELEYQSSNSISNARPQLTIERCPLPDESFDHIAQRFGFEPPRSLTFASHMNLSSTLTRQHLSMLSELVSLNLSSNGLTELPSDLFRDLEFLKDLDLSFNEIAMLPRDIFDELTDLETINLSYNAIKFVDWRLFGECMFVRELSLRGNHLTSLDHRTFHNLYWRCKIDLAENLLENLPPDAFDNARKLVLDISSNRFSTLPEELFSWTGLTELTLGHNRGNLTTLPIDFLNNATKVKKVILIRNNLTSLPENTFWGSFSVRSIDLHGNALSTLPKGIFRDSRALGFLDLSDNSLDYLPAGLFGSLSNLQELNLARNDIGSLPKNIFMNLYSLLELNLEFNKITDIEWDTFRRLPKIRSIRLSHNFVNLKTLSSLSLAKYFDAPTIQEIFLDHNNLTGWFLVHDYEIPTNLQFVNLTYNQISGVQVWSPSTGSHNVEYDFRHNNLSDILIPVQMSPKGRLLVDDNPLYCGCTVYILLEYMHKDRELQSGEDFEIILENASCSQPDWMAGTPVASLRSETFTCRPDDGYRRVRCAEGCDCWWRPHDNTRIVDCSSRNFTKMPNEIIKFDLVIDSTEYLELESHVDFDTGSFDWRDTRVELDLGNNSLTEIPTLDGSGYELVESLILSHNNISRLSFDVLPARLKIFQVDHNQLRTLNATTVEAMMKSTSLSEVNLEKNPWNCDGDTRNSLASLEAKFGKSAQYSFDMKTCLDSRQAKSPGKTDRLYISFVRF